MAIWNILFISSVRINIAPQDHMNAQIRVTRAYVTVFTAQRGVRMCQIGRRRTRERKGKKDIVG